MNITKQQKKRETLVLVILVLILAIVWLVSKFILGINFTIMEHGNIVAFGYHEIRGSEVWALSFDSFSGTVSSDGVFPENAKHRLLVFSDTERSVLTLEVKHGDEQDTYQLEDGILDLTLAGEEDKFTLTLSGNEVLSGYFSAVWE